MYTRQRGQSDKRCECDVHQQSPVTATALGIGAVHTPPYNQMGNRTESMLVVRSLQRGSPLAHSNSFFE